jgi:16S rRNA C967 or C1407 C5-methylase (RsmB/RsmF family)
MPHPFDRYADFTDLKALNEWSNKPLRKSLRVNLLKNSVEDVQKWGKKKNWQMTPVPWCEEALFIDRTNREEAQGRLGERRREDCHGRRGRSRQSRGAGHDREEINI